MLEMVPIWVTLVTGPMRDTMPSAVVGSSVGCPKAVLCGCTVRRLPSWPNSCSRPAFDDWEMPRTPTMAAMPMLMPSADSAARTRRLRSPRLPTRSRSAAVSREAPGSRTRARITDDHPVTDLDARVGGGGHTGVVGDDHDRGAALMQPAQQVQDRPAGRGVQVAGRLVGHDQGGPPDQCPGDRGALLLTAGQLVGPVPQPVIQPDHPGGFGG